MKKNLLLYITALAALFTVSCARDVMPGTEKINPDGTTNLVMRVRSAAPQTKLVPSYAEDDLNEYVLEHFYYFIYKNDPSSVATEVPVYVGKWVAPEGEKVVNKGTEENVPLDKFSTLASADGNTYSGHVYIIANYKDATYAAALDDIVNAESPDYSTLTWEYLQNLPLPATFQSYNIVGGTEIMNEKQDEGHRFKPQDSFVMASEPTPFSVQKGVEGSINADLKRLAAKVSIEIDMAEWYVQKNNGNYKYTWYSNPERIQVYLNYAADKGTMDGTPITYENAGDFFTYRRFAFVQDGVDENGDYTPATGSCAEKDPLKWILKAEPAETQPETDGNYYTNDEDLAGKIVEIGGEIKYRTINRPGYKITGTPFYSYPYDFTNDSGHAPFFKIIVEWTAYNETTVATDTQEGSKDNPEILAREFYYKITIPEIKVFQANQWIKIKLNLSTLGSEADEAAIDVSSDTYFVSDWSDPLNPDKPDINAGVYLKVAKDTYDMYEDMLQIPVSASGPLKITAFESTSGNPAATYPLGTGNTTESYESLVYSTSSSTGRNFTVKPSANTDYVQIDHTVEPFNTDFSAENGNAKDIAIITYKFRLSLDGHPNLYKDVTVYQYPSVYMKRRLSQGHSFVYYVENSGNSNVENNNDYPLGRVQTTTNYSRFFTIVSISSLAGISQTYPNWVIGDPRIRLKDAYVTPQSGQPYYVDNHATNQWLRNDLGDAPDYFDNYYVGDKDASNVLAPRFMLASGYGVNLGGGPWKTNSERCATYQEDGYPAGRWRVPTEAEILFCRKLGENGLIQNPFDTGQNYWATSGRYINSQSTFSNGTNNTSSPVRCVYDLWYWGDDPVVPSDEYKIMLPEN